MSLAMKKRQELIMERLDRDGIVYLTQLSQELNASICTIRRDFEKLEKENKCKRVHGGAVKVQNANRLSEDTDLHMSLRLKMNTEEKQALCKKCAEIIEDGDCVFIDGGTTFMYIMDYLQDKNIRVVTHNCFLKNHDDSRCTLFVLGGQNNPRYQMNLGPMTLDYLNYFHFDKAFISAAGFTLEDLNIYTGEIETAKIKQEALRRSKEKYLVVDSSKLGVYGFYTMSNLNEFQGLVTSKHVDQLQTQTKIYVTDPSF